MGQGHGPFKHKIQIKVTSTTLPQNLNSLTVENMPAKWPIDQGHPKVIFTKKIICYI